jgi:ubiquinol-cytochrome c reductase cytochrome c1 subunit
MMIVKTLRTAVAALVLATGGAWAAGGAGYVQDYDFPHEGPFGTYDRGQLQRGFEVYNQVCSACHGLEQVYFRNLMDESGPGFPEGYVNDVASNYFVPDDSLGAFPGDEREAKLSDQFPGSALENAPDLSLMAKARAGFHGPYGLGINQLVKGMGGPEYIASLLTHYTGEEKEEAGSLFYGNETFPGGWIAMAPPLWGDDVFFEDGSPTDLESLSQDVAAFLMWSAEPKLVQRKQAGLVGVLLVGLLTVLLYFVNKKLWYPIKHRQAHMPAE